MSEVYANGHEISAKKDSNKSMGAMPDVCMSPPSPPAGPISIPYPNFAQGSKTHDGTKSVKLGKKQVGIKNKSNYKKSKGNEAATRNFGMNVITHTISGKMRHAKWSMDVKFEGKNVIRQFDLTTHNHGSQGGGGTMINGGKFKKAPPKKADCEALDNQNKNAQAQKHPRTKKTSDGETIASSQYNGPDGSAYQMNSSSHMSSFTKSNGWAHGYRNKDGSFKPTKLCKEAKFKYSSRQKCQSPTCHAESRIIESIFRKFGPNPKGTLALRISHRPKGSKRAKNRPCKSCKKMLCAAKKCGLKIMLCTSRKSKPKKIRCKK